MEAFGIDKPEGGWLEEFDPGHEAVNIVMMVVVFVGFGLISSLTWLMFGTGLRAIVTDRRSVRIFNISMAVLLAASLVPVLFEG